MSAPGTNTPINSYYFYEIQYIRNILYNKTPFYESASRPAVWSVSCRPLLWQHASAVRDKGGCEGGVSSNGILGLASDMPSSGVGKSGAIILVPNIKFNYKHKQSLHKLPARTPTPTHIRKSSMQNSFWLRDGGAGTMVGTNKWSGTTDQKYLAGTQQIKCCIKIRIICN